YCAVCHDDNHRNGGLSLQHFDAGTVEPSLAAMMVSKLKTGAIGASGQQADPGTEAAMIEALTAKSAGANGWVLTTIENSQQTSMSVSIVHEGPATQELYRETGQL